MLQTISLHWNKNIHLKLLEPSILQSFHVVWNPYILNNIGHSKPYQLDILFIFYEYFPDIAHYTISPSLPSRQRDAIIRGVRPVGQFSRNGVGRGLFRGSYGLYVSIDLFTSVSQIYGCFFPRDLVTSHFINLYLTMAFQYLESTLHTFVASTSDKPRTSFQVVRKKPLLKWYV